MDMTIGIKLPVGEVPAKVCMLIKKTTGLALGEIKARARDDEYIFECPVCDDDGLKLINSLNGGAREMWHQGEAVRLRARGKPRVL